MCEGGQAHVVDGGDDQARRDSARFLRVVGGTPFAHVPLALALSEQNDDPRRVRDVLLHMVGSERADQFCPCLRHPLFVGPFLLLLCCLADLSLQFRVGNRNEGPRLEMSTRGRRACRLDGQLNQIARHLAAGEMTCGPTFIHLFVERPRAREHLVGRNLLEDERNETGF